MLFLLLLLISVWSNCYASNTHASFSRLLFVSYTQSSHVKQLISIARALPLEYHVTFAVVDEQAQMVRDKLEPYRLLTIVSLGTLLKPKEKYELGYGESNLQFLNRVVLPDLVSDYVQIHDPLYIHLQNHSYDMMVSDFCALAAQDLAHDLGVPMVIFSAIDVTLGLDYPAWVPHSTVHFTQQQLRYSFFQRFHNQIMTPALLWYYLGSYSGTFNRLRRALNRTIPKAAYGLTGSHWDNYPVLISNTIALEFRYTYKPNHFFLGFIVDDQRTDHTIDNEELHIVEEWLSMTQGPDDFVVLVAFGTLNVVRAEIWKQIINTLQFVPHMRLLLVIPQQTIRIRVQNLAASIVNYPSRILFVSWIKQQNVLAHPSVRLFIMHGGLNSVGEAVYAHVPMIILPGFGDQFPIAAKIMEANIGYTIERDVLTTEQLASCIKMILADYDNFVSRLQRIHRISEFEGGAQRVAALIDGWLITGYTHLITIEHELPFIVAYSLDVRIALLAIIIFICYVIYWLAKCIVCRSSYRKKLKQS